MKSLGLVFVLLALLGIGCEREAEPPPAPTTVTPDITAAAPAKPSLRYFRFPLTGASALRVLIARIGEENFDLVLKLNRIDAGYARRGDTLIVPDPVPELMELSPFPDEITAGRKISKLLLISLRVQAWGAYENGRLLRWGPTSTGRRSMPTPPGLYHTNWKSRARVSTFNDSWHLKWVFNFENFSGCSIHEYALPGRPASHSCVRTLAEDASWIYFWAEQWILTNDENTVLKNGTPLIVFGEYDFNSSPPWKRLPEDHDVLRLTTDETELAVSSHSFESDEELYTKEALRISVAVTALDDSLRRRVALDSPIIARLAVHFQGDSTFTFSHGDSATATVHMLARMEEQLDFNALRSVLASAGLASGEIRVRGTGKAQRVLGMSSMVASDGTVIYLLETLALPGLDHDKPVVIRFEAIVGPLSDVEDRSSPFRLILKSVDRVLE